MPVMMVLLTIRKSLFALAFVLPSGLCQGDNLGLSGGYITVSTTNFDAQIVRNAQVLASLKPKGSTFDFLPYDKLSVRAANRQYHWGDITYRYRVSGTTAWTDGDSATARQPITAYTSRDSTAVAASNLRATLPTGPLNITREWLNVSGDLGLRFTIANTGTTAVELGSLGFPAEFNSIFTNRAATDTQRLCSLSDPYIGMHAGYIRANPISGTGAALVVTPLNSTDTPFEAYRNLVETVYSSTGYGSQTFEGLYEWQTLSKAWAEKEWASTKPWNPPSSTTLQPGQSLSFGLRFSVARDGVRDIDTAVRNTGTPVAVGIPGYIIPRGSASQLFLNAPSAVTSLVSDPAGALTVTNVGTTYTVTPASSAWGRVRLVITYADRKTQVVHYHVTKANNEVLSNLGSFLTTQQWYEDTTDPFGRAPSVMTYDYETRSIVLQDSRVWVAGLSDEGGVGAYLAAVAKQAIQPDAAEVAKLERFINEVVWGKIQRTNDYAVRKSIFYYQPNLVPNYRYNTSLDWTSWTSWNQQAAYAIDRAYDYVHVAAAYWSLYRVARAYPALVTTHDWAWYLDHAYQTVIRGMKNDVGYNRVGLMGETVFGEILNDLIRENQSASVTSLTSAMRTRAQAWDTQAVPYGSEMAWDSTGQEGVYYWAKYFGFTNTVTKTVNSVLGYMPTVPHWGWNGNARRYWDNIYGGKLKRIERQIHHYGSGLNALVLLGAFRSNPTDSYLLQVGYGGTSGPLSNINQDGFASASFHSWPSTLKWDGISGDYGPGFLGMIFGSGTYVAQHPTFGLVAYGGVISSQASGRVTVSTYAPVRRRVFIGPLGITINTDAGVIASFSYTASSGALSLTLNQHTDGPVAAAAIIWIESNTASVSYTTTFSGATRSRGGWRVPLSSSAATTVELTRA